MKKETLILISLILVLGGYLFLHKGNKEHNTLPEIKKIDTDTITGIIIDKERGTIKFTKDGKNWTLTDKKYLADSPSVENMLDTFKNFKLSTLVSEKGNLKRYELDDAKQIRVKLLQDGKTIFELRIGKTAPSFNHTFVMLANNRNIYHANGSFRSYFEKSEDDYRDKKVLTFKEESIKKIFIEKDGLSKTLLAEEKKEQSKNKEKEIKVTWRSEDETPADTEQVSDLLSAVSFLECETYLDSTAKNDLEKKDPLCRINLENKDNLSLTLFKGDKEGSIFGSSSMSKYAFELNQFNGKEIISAVEKLLGIEAKKEDKK